MAKQRIQNDDLSPSGETGNKLANASLEAQKNSKGTANESKKGEKKNKVTTDESKNAQRKSRTKAKESDRVCEAKGVCGYKYFQVISLFSNSNCFFCFIIF